MPQKFSSSHYRHDYRQRQTKIVILRTNDDLRRNVQNAWWRPPTPTRKQWLIYQINKKNILPIRPRHPNHPEFIDQMRICINQSSSIIGPTNLSQTLQDKLDATPIIGNHTYRHKAWKIKTPRRKLITSAPTYHHIDNQNIRINDLRAFSRRHDHGHKILTSLLVTERQIRNGTLATRHIFPRTLCVANQIK